MIIEPQIAQSSPPKPRLLRHLTITLAGRIIIFLLSVSSGSALAESVSLIWDANPEPDIAGYRLYYGPSSGNYVEQIDVGNTTSATVANLITGITYFFAVTAYDTMALESEFSNEVSTTIGGGHAPARLLNISTRLRVLGGDNALIVGVSATGTGEKRMVVRAIGPTLSGFGVPGALPDPTLELYQGDTFLFGNDNWRSSVQQSEIENSGFAPSEDAESAIIWMLIPGESYTAVMRGKNGQTGIGIVEAFDLDHTAASKLGSISTRGFVELDDNVMIAGVIAGPDGAGAIQILARALGPTLADFGVSHALPDPTLQLLNSNGTVIRSNDNWRDSQSEEIEASGLAPNHNEESALIETIAPGAYTAIVRGNARTTGIGLVEVYQVP